MPFFYSHILPKATALYSIFKGSPNKIGVDEFQ
jgi:hypothetical protein